MTLRRFTVDEWAREVIAIGVRHNGGRPLPPYGSPAWMQLPDRQRWASILIAAEAWRTDGTPEALAVRFAIDLEQPLVTAKRAEDEEFAARAAAHRKTWAYLRGAGRRVEWRDDIDEPEDLRHGPITTEELATHDVARRGRRHPNNPGAAA